MDKFLSTYYNDFINGKFINNYKLLTQTYNEFVDINEKDDSYKLDMIWLDNKETNKKIQESINDKLYLVVLLSLFGIELITIYAKNNKKINCVFFMDNYEINDEHINDNEHKNNIKKVNENFETFYDCCKKYFEWCENKNNNEGFKYITKRRRSSKEVSEDIEKCLLKRDNIFKKALNISKISADTVANYIDKIKTNLTRDEFNKLSELFSKYNLVIKKLDDDEKFEIFKQKYKYCIDNDICFTDMEFNIDNNIKQSVYSYIENICKNYNHNDDKEDKKKYILKFKDISTEKRLCYMINENGKISRSCYGTLTEDEK